MSPDSDALGVVALLHRHDALRTSSNVSRRPSIAGESTSGPPRTFTSREMRAPKWARCSASWREIEKAAEDLRGVKGVLDGGWLVAAPSVAGGRTGHHHPHGGRG